MADVNQDSLINSVRRRPKPPPVNLQYTQGCIRWLFMLIHRPVSLRLTPIPNGHYSPRARFECLLFWKKKNEAANETRHGHLVVRQTFFFQANSTSAKAVVPSFCITQRRRYSARKEMRTWLKFLAVSRRVVDGRMRVTWFSFSLGPGQGKWIVFLLLRISSCCWWREMWPVSIVVGHPAKQDEEEEESDQMSWCLRFYLPSFDEHDGLDKIVWWSHPIEYGNLTGSLTFSAEIAAPLFVKCYQFYSFYFDNRCVDSFWMT